MNFVLGPANDPSESNASEELTDKLYPMVINIRRCSKIFSDGFSRGVKHRGSGCHFSKKK